MDVLGLGQSNDGVFSRAEALDAGESDDTLASLRRRGVLVRLRRGMYVLTDRYAAADDTGKHVLHARAELAAQRGQVALTGLSAAAVRGYTIYQQDLSVVHLVRLDEVSGRRTPTVNHHRVLMPLGPEDVEVVQGLPVVGAARAVWEVACRSSLEAGVVTADSALRQDGRLAAALAELDERFTNVPGSRRARIALRLADPRAESAGESVTRVQCFRYGIPAPELQHPVWNARGELVARTDFWWEEFRHAAEFDGKIKYGRLLREGETPSEAVVTEKLREDAVRAEGCGMTRFVWSMVMPDQARRSMAALAAALDRSSRLYVTGVGLRLAG